METALDAGFVAGETIKFGGQRGVVEYVEVAFGGGGQFRFHAADAAKIPGGGDELIEQDLLDSALRTDVGLELGEEFVEFFSVFSADDELGGGEPVLAGVLRGAGLAFGGSGASAEAGVGRVGGLACF